MKLKVVAAVVAYLSLNTTCASESIATPIACNDPTIHYIQHENVRLAYAVAGHPKGRPLILVGGVDQQLTDWPDSLIKGLVARGFYVVRYDARDVGCSTRFDGAPPIDWTAVFESMSAGKSTPLPYSSLNLSNDLLALINKLEFKSVSLMGASGGSSIAALTTSRVPTKVSMLILLMANSGNPKHPVPANPARLASLGPPPTASTPHEGIVEYRRKTAEALEGSSIARTKEDINEWARSSVKRSYNPEGVSRTGAALLLLGDMRAMLKTIITPTLVINGSEDPLISPASGEEVAKAIPQASFVLIKGMGHSLPSGGVKYILEEIDRMKFSYSNHSAK
jgi:pimeloyl-ACP methyl ester carboxylesterase